MESVSSGVSHSHLTGTHTAITQTLRLGRIAQDPSLCDLCAHLEQEHFVRGDTIVRKQIQRMGAHEHLPAAPSQDAGEHLYRTTFGKLLLGLPCVLPTAKALRRDPGLNGHDARRIGMPKKQLVPHGHPNKQ